MYRVCEGPLPLKGLSKRINILYVCLINFPRVYNSLLVFLQVYFYKYFYFDGHCHFEDGSRTIMEERECVEHNTLVFVHNSTNNGYLLNPFYLAQGIIMHLIWLNLVRNCNQIVQMSFT